MMSRHTAAVMAVLPNVPKALVELVVSYTSPTRLFLIGGTPAPHHSSFKTRPLQGRVVYYDTRTNVWEELPDTLDTSRLDHSKMDGAQVGHLWKGTARRAHFDGMNTALYAVNVSILADRADERQRAASDVGSITTVPFTGEGDTVSEGMACLEAIHEVSVTPLITPCQVPWKTALEPIVFVGSWMHTVSGVGVSTRHLDDPNGLHRFAKMPSEVKYMHQCTAVYYRQHIVIATTGAVKDVADELSVLSCKLENDGSVATDAKENHNHVCRRGCAPSVKCDFNLIAQPMTVAYCPSPLLVVIDGCLHLSYDGYNDGVRPFFRYDEPADPASTGSWAALASMPCRQDPGVAVW